LALLLLILIVILILPFQWGIRSTIKIRSGRGRADQAGPAFFIARGTLF
jgi:hypothetical protein